jgi:hypothetical protein
MKRKNEVGTLKDEPIGIFNGSSFSVPTSAFLLTPDF